MAEGTVVFDDAPELAAAGGTTTASLVLVDGDREHMVVDGDTGRSVRELDGSDDFVVFDAPAGIQETLEAEPDFVLIDASPTPAHVRTDEGDLSNLVLQAGGRPGSQGPQGPPGQDGPGAYYQEFGFASPAALWVIPHGRNTFGLNVETVDTSGESVEGDVRFVDANTVEVEWYFPMAGTARVFR